MNNITIFSDINEISQAVAKKWAVLSEQAISDHGGFHVALSGGSTPAHLYNYLATSAYKQRINWDKTYIYFGDERSVSPDHKESNFKMASDTLLDKVDIPVSQIYRMKAEVAEIEESAVEYAALLKDKLPMSENGESQFDLVLLGMGDDGHTASLFPGTQILQEKSELVRAVFVEKMKTWRMSITFRAINNARNIAVLVTGENKKKVLSKVLETGVANPLYPIMMIQPSGHIEWYIDAAAASGV
ncbi:MAG: 6-phosphogluconolactonase [Gammaproteobacteria bacterium]|nr:6-phosphogluconolactonase [Gammaproteobacteria bacterium]